jgi:recombination protein RecT
MTANVEKKAEPQQPALIRMLNSPEVVAKLEQAARGALSHDPKALKAVIGSMIARAHREPDLLKCTADSVLSCVHYALSVGLDPSLPHGHIYIIPRKNKHQGGALRAEPMIGFKGFIELARRNGVLVNAQVVYRGELQRGLFEYDVVNAEVRHKYDPEVDRSDDQVALAYARAVFGSGQAVAEVLSRKQIEARRDRSAASRHGPWTTDFAAMARKSAVRALMSSGLVPLSPDVLQVIRNDEVVETSGTRSFSGTFTAAQADDVIDYDQIPEITAFEPDDGDDENTDAADSASES